MDFSSFEALIFDVDGTIVDSAPTVLSCLKKAIEEQQLSYDETLFNATLIGPPLDQMIATLCPATEEEKRAKIKSSFRKFYDENPWNGTTLFSGIKPLLETEKQCFIATNKPEKATRDLLKAFHLNIFKAVYCPDTFSNKILTKAEMIQEIVSVFDLNPSKTLMVGDAVSDMTAAATAGVKRLAVLWGYEKNKAELKQHADFVLEGTYD